jgi:hypothetical protein
MNGIVLTAILAIPCLTIIVLLCMVLRFSNTMVDKSGDTKCLRDVAVLLRAFQTGPGGLFSTLAKEIGRRSLS